MKTQKPVNQKSIFNSYTDLYDKVMNDEISLEKAEIEGNMLKEMNFAYKLEIEQAEFEIDLANLLQQLKITRN